jgi:hypothetical protein
MKKLSIMALALTGLMLVSCKKDRVCSCKSFTKIESPGFNNTQSGPEEEYTIKEASYKTAYYACTHKQTVYSEDNTTITFDMNCSLK